MASAFAPVHTTVVGVFNDLAHARDAIDGLRRAGFRDDRIGLLGPDWRPAGDTEPLGGVAGLTVAVARTTRVGPAVAGGVLVTVFTSDAGGLAGGLSGAGFTEEDSQWFEDQVKAGRTIVTVHEADERAEDARDVLRKHDGSIREPSPVGIYGAGLPATPY